MCLRVVYVDILFLTNALIAFLLLRVTAKLSFIYLGMLRSALASMASGLIAVVMYFPRVEAIPAVLIKAAICLLICEIAFGKRMEGARVRVCMTFCGISFGFAGCVMGLLYISAPTGKISISNGVAYFDLSAGLLIFFCVIAYILFSLVGGSGRLKANKKSMSIKCALNGKEAEIKALCDSGNLLRDPLSGKKIIMASKSMLMPLFSSRIQSVLFDLTQDNATDCFTLLASSGEGAFRLVPYKDITKAEGMVIAVRPDKLFIDDKPQSGYLLGISVAEIETADGCRAIMGV